MMPRVRIFLLFLIAAMSLGETHASPRQDHSTEIENARRAYWAGSFEGAIGDLEPLLGKLEDPQLMREAAFLLGLNYLALGEKPKGEDYFAKAVISDPDFTPAEDLYPPDIINSYLSIRARAIGRISVESVPSGATVHIGERAVGKTPYTGSTTAGERTVRLELQGHSGQARKVLIVPGETHDLSFELGREAVAEPTVPADPDRPAEQFDNVKLLVQEGETPVERDVILRLDGSHLVVLAKMDGQEIKKIPYREIRSAEYSYSKHPRWKEGSAVGILSAPVFFLKGKKHWFAVQTENDHAVLHLDKNNYEIICLSFEVYSDIRIEYVGEK